MTPTTVPDPTAIRTYLAAHGWTAQRAADGQGTLFGYREADDDGSPITVFVPASPADDYPLRVADVVDTVSAVEGRSRAAVETDLARGAAPDPPQL